MIAALAAATAMVLSVPDGNTLLVQQGSKTRTVHLHGTDVPRISPPDCGGWEAQLNLQKLAPFGARVTLRSQSVSLGGRDLGRAQVRAGWARSSAKRYRAAQRAARRQSVGVWERCSGNFHRPLD